MLYLRQSVSRDDSISLELQETACRDYCARRGYSVVEVISDPGISGRTWNRPGVQRTLDLVETGKADVIVLWRWSRLSRSRKDWAVAVDRVDVAGGAIESATEPVDVSTAAGRLQRGMLAELAAWESEVKGEQWKETHARRRSKGLHHSGGHRHGYVYREDKTWEPDPDMAPLVVSLYQQYVAGKGYASLADWCRAVGLPPRVPGTQWTQRGVASALQSGFAAGLINVHDPDCGCRKASSCTRRLMLPGSHEPIVDQKLWEAFVAERRRRAGTPARLLSPGTPLAGLVRCGSCGYSMPSMGRKRRGYQCPNRGCAEPSSVTLARAEAEAVEWLRGYADDVSRSAAIASSDQASRATAKSAVTRLARAVARLDAELVTLTREYGRGVIPEGAYVAARDELAREREAAHGELDRAAARLAPARPSRRSAADVIAHWDTLPPAKLNKVLQPLLRVVVSRGPWRSEVRVVPAWEWTPGAGRPPAAG